MFKVQDCVFRAKRGLLLGTGWTLVRAAFLIPAELRAVGKEGGSGAVREEGKGKNKRGSECSLQSVPLGCGHAQ